MNGFPNPLVDPFALNWMKAADSSTPAFPSLAEPARGASSEEGAIPMDFPNKMKGFGPLYVAEMVKFSTYGVAAQASWTGGVDRGHSASVNDIITVLGGAVRVDRA